MAAISGPTWAGQATENPLNAILKAYQAIEYWYDDVLGADGVDVREDGNKLGVAQMSVLAVERGLLSESTIGQVDELGLMRDLALQDQGKKATAEQAREYLLLVDGLLFALDADLAKHRPNGSPARREP